VSSLFLVPTASDAAQRTRVIDPSQSFLVQAPAGSGKTELLIQRYLRLLAIVEKPERIQAITFTRKAAGEMRDRIIQTLKGARTNQEPLEPHKQVTHDLASAALARDEKLGWRVLENPSRMKLQTIDSLCGGIVAQMPWLARQGGVPEVIEDATSLYLQAARRTLSMVEEEGRHRQHLERLLLHLDNNAARVAKLIAAMLATRDQWLEEAVPINDDSRFKMEEQLRSIIGERFTAIENTIPMDDLILLRRLIPEDWRGIARTLLVGNQWRKRLDKACGFPPDRKQEKAACAALIDRLSEVAGLRESLAFVKTLPPKHYTQEQWQVTRSILECLKLAVAHLRVAFQEEGCVDFCEIAQAAGNALHDAEDPTELALKLDARIEHILIDEFQDTSQTQFELTKKLIEGWEPGDGRTIFLVGDPMQSIYRFRQAEVALFLQVKDEGIGLSKPESLVLKANYRSVQDIVSWANRTFSSIFPARNDAELGAIRYSPSQATKPAIGSAVSFHAIAEKEDRREAEIVVDLIRQSRRQNPEGTVAILVRARTHLPAIVDALKDASLTFRAVEIDDLSERPSVRDLLSLTRALLHPGDRLSWLAILRAPWCGLTLADLHAIAASDRTSFIYDILHGPLDALTNDGRARATRLLNVIDGALEKRGRVALRAWIEETWCELGGPWAYEDQAALQDSADFLDLLESEQSGSDLPDFDGFAKRVAQLKAKADPAANEWLQIMTIHKAKGLEFDTVILPGMGRKARGEEAKLIRFHRGLIAPIKDARAESDPMYAYLAELEKQRDQQEVVRQLYVAVTRAREHLHLIGYMKLNKAGPKPMSGSFLSALWDGLTAEEQKVFEDKAVAQPQVASPHRHQNPLRRVPSHWAPPPRIAPILPAKFPFAATEIEQPTFEWVGENLRYAGTVVHELLRRMAKTGSGPVDALMIRRTLSQLGVPQAELEQTALRVEKAIERTLASDKGRWILAPHNQSRCEMAVAGVVDGEIVHGTIDRTFVDDQGIRWVIDFKTSVHQGSGVAEFLNEQVRRYRAQLARYAKLLAPFGQPVRLGLYFPLLDEWREWEMEDATTHG
jgi:ATP-dependent helicase/nuclease subunit A